MPRVPLKKQQKSQPVVVIAGAAGFVGSHLAESLLNSGAKVIGLDDLATGSIANMASFHRHPNFDFIECNVNRLIPEELYTKRITHIVHAMGLDTHAPNKNATLASLLAGSFATKNLLDLAVKRGSVFLLSSSISVYEGLASSTSLNNYFGSTQHQKAQYSLYEAKRYSEGLCQMYAEEYNLDVRVARLSTVYGPRMDLCDDSFLDTLVQQTLDGQDLIIDEEGSQEVHLTYIDDVIYGMSKLMFAEGEKFYQSIYPIVSPEKTSVISVAYTLRTFLPPGKEVKFTPQSSNVPYSKLDIAFDRTRRDLDWEPHVSLTDGLKMTIESFRSGTSQHIRRHVVGRDLFTTTPPKDSTTAKNDELMMPVAGIAMHDGSAPKPTPVPTITNSRKNSELVSLMGEGDSQPKLPFRKSTREPSRVADDKDGGALKREGGESKISSEKSPNMAASSSRVRLTKQSWWRRLLFAALLIGLYGVLGRPVIHTAAYTTIGGWDMYRGVQAAKSLDFGTSEVSFRNSSGQFADAKESVEGLAPIAGLIGLSSWHDELEQSLTALSVSIDSLSELSRAAKPWPAHLEQLWPSEDGEHSEVASGASFDQLVAETKVSLAQARDQMGRAQALLPGGDYSRVAGASIADGKEVVTSTTRGNVLSGLLRHMLAEAQLYLTQGEQALEVLPVVLGQDEQKRYLLMFQNNNELRPTGGFMGSYGVLTTEKGRVLDFFIDDIYNPDGQLESDLSSPTPLQQQFHYDKVTLRDSNWSPDVPTSAELIIKLYGQATGQDIDGVFFVTARAVQPILKALGPIHLQNFNETVTAENFYELTQTHSNVGFVPGSTGKRDFLGVLGEAIMARIEQGGNGDMLKVAQAISHSLNAKEVQLYFEDPAVEVLINQYDWSGRVKQTDGDYLRVVDANIGANKSNYFISRSTDYAINVDRNSHLEAVVTITWQHNGTSGTWPGGNYRNYVRVYAPDGSQLTQSDNFDSDAIDVSLEQGKQVFGGYVTVPYNSQKSVTLRYRLPDRLGLLESNGEYRLLWQKQSGLGNEPLKVAFNTPSFITADSASDAGVLSDDGRVSWTVSEPARDQNFSLYLSQ